MASNLLKQANLGMDEIIHYAYQFAHEYDREYGNPGFGRSFLPENQLINILADKAMNSIPNCNMNDANRVAVASAKILSTMGITLNKASAKSAGTRTDLFPNSDMKPTPTDMRNISDMHPEINPKPEDKQAVAEEFRQMNDPATANDPQRDIGDDERLTGEINPANAMAQPLHEDDKNYHHPWGLGFGTEPESTRYGSKEAQSEDTLYSHVEGMDAAAYQILKEYADHYGDKHYRQHWELVPAGRLKKIWNDYAKLGFVRDEAGINKIANTIIENVHKIEVNNILTGHSPQSATDWASQFLEEKLPEDYFEVNESFFDDEHGSWRISDYAADKLSAAAMSLQEAKSAEEKLQIIDHILNITHQRSDLAGWFVEGGVSTLNQLAGKKASKVAHEEEMPHPDTGVYDEADEAKRRKVAEIEANYDENGEMFDPSGDYLCATCSQFIKHPLDDVLDSEGEKGACGTVEGGISGPTGSCAWWQTGTPLVQIEHKFDQKIAGYTERPNVKGFGCHRCEYGAKAKQADSKGRTIWCGFWGARVLPNACCAKNEGDDDVFAPDQKSKSARLLKKKKAADIIPAPIPGEIVPKRDKRWKLYIFPDDEPRGKRYYVNSKEDGARLAAELFNLPTPKQRDLATVGATKWNNLTLKITQWEFKNAVNMPSDKALKFHDDPEFLPPRDDMKRHLDKDQLDPSVIDIQKKKLEGPEPSTGHVPLRSELSQRTVFASDDSYWVDLLESREARAKEAFMNSDDMKQIAQDNGWTMEKAWRETGADFTNALYDQRNRVIATLDSNRRAPEAYNQILSIQERLAYLITGEYARNMSDTLLKALKKAEAQIDGIVENWDSLEGGQPANHAFAEPTRQDQITASRIQTTPMSEEWKARLLPHLKAELEKRPDLQQLRAKILEFGGEEALIEGLDNPPNEVERLLTRGKFWQGNAARMKKGLSNRCHGNAACLMQEGFGEVVNGYALSADGLWRPHSWVLTPEGGLLETTKKREAYFGAVLTRQEVDDEIDTN